jgi:hypothetical protein
MRIASWPDRIESRIAGPRVTSHLHGRTRRRTSEGFPEGSPCLRSGASSGDGR